MIRLTRIFTQVVGLAFVAASCRTHRIRQHISQEFISLKLLNSNEYNYLYYNWSDTSFIYKFNEGLYTVDRDIYRLLPKPFDNTNVKVKVIQSKSDSISSGIALHIRTNIKGDYLNEYAIQVMTGDVRLKTFQGVSVDTILASNIDSFKVKVLLANHFINGMGNQKPTFKEVKTEMVTLLPGQNEVTIHIPISFATYFYNYEKEIVLRSNGIFWQLNGNNVPMRNAETYRQDIDNGKEKEKDKNENK